MKAFYTFITNQEALSFMFDLKRSNKIKNDKITINDRWRLELSCYNNDIL